ncbi:MAG: hypothetical protein J0L77_09050 [Alphaproteobacteria bacterium]|nr:hypothetical protein [Alphaproteobacteria bacterium]
MRHVLHQYLRQTVGVVAVAFGLMIPVIISAAGVSIDISQAYLVRERLSHALDAAALAAAASSADTEEEIEAKVDDFIAANYPPDKVGYTLDVDVDINGSELTVNGTARLDTSFMRIVGIETVDVASSTVVQREVSGIEVVLVLDNTGSMASNNNIVSLKQAATDFINIMFDETTDPNLVRIGLVPYSNSVRVGGYGLGLNPNGTMYGDGVPFVTLPPSVTYTTTRASYNWYGCVVEHRASGYQPTATHVTNSKGQLWRFSGNWAGHGWNAASTTNDPYPDDTYDSYTGPWDIYYFGKVISSGQNCGSGGYSSSSRCTSCLGSSSSCNQSYCFCWKSTSTSAGNEGCPYAMVQPLTSDRTLLLSQVEPSDANDMIPDGNTLGNIGMVWGYRMISPERPFIEGRPWGDENWRKVIILMTDGDNTLNGTYSSYWFANKDNMNVTKLNQRMEETCTSFKNRDPNNLVYTVTFTSGINEDTKGYYRRCATDEEKYYDAPTQEELVDVFRKIARELSNLRIKQ